MPKELGMLKRFRRRFVLITMVLVGVVALVAFLAVDVANYQSMRAEIGRALNKASQPSTGWEYHAETLPDSDGQDDGDQDGKGPIAIHSIPLCTVTVSYTDTSSLSDVYDSIPLDDATLAAAVQEALASSAGATSASDLNELADYGLYYRVNSTQTGFKVAFVPKSVLWDDLGQRTLVLVGAWVLLMLAVFAITLFLSRYVARPVEQAWRDQQRFIADASHELKTPLTVIMADVDILKESPEKSLDEQRKWVESISTEADRMKQLTEDLLTLAQADAGVDMKQVMGDVDFSSVVEGQVLQFDAVAFERGLSLDDEGVADSLHVVGDQVRLENMVKTLLENACKYSERGATVDVALRPVKGNAVLTVHNEGDPIPAEDLPHLFDRFYRSDKARVREGETASFGLGLSIAKSTAELHGGEISVASGAGGTTFTVRIPLAR